jgi:hypothetical protein
MFGGVLAKWDALDPSVKNAVYVVAIVAVLLKLVTWFTNESSGRTRDRARLAMLVRNAARWSAAAEQDASLLMGLIHANYAAAYLQVLKESHEGAALDAAAAPVTFVELEAQVMAVQNRLQARISEACPDIQPVSALEAYAMM